MGTSLRLAGRSEETPRAWYPRWDSNPHLSDFKSPASAGWATGARTSERLHGTGQLVAATFSAAGAVATAFTGAASTGCGGRGRAANSSNT